MMIEHLIQQATIDFSFVISENVKGVSKFLWHTLSVSHLYLIVMLTDFICCHPVASVNRITK